jgi:esterase/lipase superfamily enzyme
MLVFTHRDMNNASDESAFERSFTPGSDRLGMATVSKNGTGWRVSDAARTVDDNDAIKTLDRLFHQGVPVLLYLHGNSNTPANTFERCAELEAGYGVETIALSWASEGYLPDGVTPPGGTSPDAVAAQDLADIKAARRRSVRDLGIIQCYHQAKKNAEAAVNALERLLRLINVAGSFAQRAPCSIAGHSLGAYLLRHTLDVGRTRQWIGGMASNVVLLAPCVPAKEHRFWLEDVMPAGQVFVCYNQNDSVLEGARFADKHMKLGMNPGDDRHVWHRVRYVDFTNAIDQRDTLGHGYFVPDSSTRKGRALFQRLFTSRRDFTEPPGEPKDIYPVGCDNARLTCYMGFQASGGEGPI